jgi:hypothetical protein
MSVRGNLIGLAAVACSVFLADKWISAKAVVAPEVAMQSDFLRLYNPVPLLNSFRVGCQSRTGVGTGSSSSAGYRFLRDFKNVHYSRTAHMELCDQSQYPTVLTALHRSVISALSFSGCKVDSDDFAVAGGVQISYRCGTRTAGYVTSGSKMTGETWPAYVTLQLNEEWNVRNPL